MTAALLFAATFAAVFTLGVQQINVERRHVLAAAATSPLIGLAHLALFKILPGPTLGIEVAAYLAGGSAGIAASIWAHPRLRRLLAGLRRAPAPSSAETEDALRQRAERLGETLRLATQIADDSARADVESSCDFERMGQHTWYDPSRVARTSGPEVAAMVAKAIDYLRLRGRIVSHPTQPHLVRFEP